MYVATFVSLSTCNFLCPNWTRNRASIFMYAIRVHASATDPYCIPHGPTRVAPDDIWHASSPADESSPPTFAKGIVCDNRRPTPRRLSCRVCARKHYYIMYTCKTRRRRPIWRSRRDTTNQKRTVGSCAFQIDSLGPSAIIIYIYICTSERVHHSIIRRSRRLWCGVPSPSPWRPRALSKPTPPRKQCVPWI